MTNRWNVEFEGHAGQGGMALLRHLPPGYRQVTPPEVAALDWRQIESLPAAPAEHLLLQPQEGGAMLRHYSRQDRYLDEFLAPLRHLGLRVLDQSRFVFPLPQGSVYLRVFYLDYPPQRSRLAAAASRVISLLDAVLAGRCDDDSLNELVLAADLDWRQIGMLRAYRNYWFQLGQPYGAARFRQVLLQHRDITRLLVEYFGARFDPERSGPGAAAAPDSLRERLLKALGTLTTLDADRILRGLFQLLEATVRTNFYRPGAEDRFAFKLENLQGFSLPSPRPRFEVFVHGPAVAAVHLRGDRIARGGIRWSDRPDDFRTEIWELMRTQMLKNALIVPQGAKGGFVTRNGAEGEAAYGAFMRALLDLTDNLEGGRVVHPPRVVCHDGDDPYLVVAADKGTAHLSDTANRIAAEYGFWLRDAFASGGSHGYDHKRLGITARGAWVCARRHFAELGRDLEREPVTVVGVGSMRGDVFGNGMLLSKRIKLLAAFSSRDIFIDPDPDPEAAWRERKRLFEAEAGWDRYDRSLISPGGGVWPRRARRIPLSSQVRRWLGIRAEAVDGETLIRHLLTAEADLLWFGGIGTYVKARTEKHADVGDPANDNVRVDAERLQVQVVAEGANLGMTQWARIEYALRGGRVNMDAVDNSGGVDLSDHEVNYKILLYQAETLGLLGGEAPHEWLARVTDEAVARVLGHNESQSLCLSLEQRRCRRDPMPHLEVAERLERAGLLNRAAESFPDTKTVLRRPDRSLTRPELAVLLALAKLYLKQQLQAHGEWIGRPFLRRFLSGYFPAGWREPLASVIEAHPLAQAITVTDVVNYLLDRSGVTFVTLVEADGILLEHAIATWLGLDAVFQAQTLRRAVEASGDWSRRDELRLRVEDALLAGVRWFLGRGRQLSPEPDLIERCRRFWRDYLTRFPPAAAEDERVRLQGEGLAEASAAALAVLADIDEFLVLTDLALESGRDFPEVARSLRAVADCLDLTPLHGWLARLPVRSLWEERLRQSLGERLWAAAAALTRQALALEAGDVGLLCTRPTCLQRFNRFRRFCHEQAHQSGVDLASLAAIVLELEAMVEAAA
ncbi:glutamate dehydrogenase [Methylomarinovum tepidoasis]|uniref:Glutamate dehydrogenase n=1 Tax=Methylomarinovum tepidoasis TaxID=2840183 RepID=A0AAU9CY78_9GAMM|nr:NAD-glutamate dehydrogenase domain-containing protein [Methylomarinovum sp. IN45]BCX89665.1 glutamate dehydrogenase [Methylomarinovum sp. IN45]